MPKFDIGQQVRVIGDRDGLGHGFDPDTLVFVREHDDSDNTYEASPDGGDALAMWISERDLRDPADDSGYPEDTAVETNLTLVVGRETHLPRRTRLVVVNAAATGNPALSDGDEVTVADNRASVTDLPYRGDTSIYVRKFGGMDMTRLLVQVGGLAFPERSSGEVPGTRADLIESINVGDIFEVRGEESQTGHDRLPSGTLVRITNLRGQEPDSWHERTVISVRPLDPALDAQVSDDYYDGTLMYLGGLVTVDATPQAFDTVIITEGSSNPRWITGTIGRVRHVEDADWMDAPVARVVIFDADGNRLAGRAFTYGALRVINRVPLPTENQWQVGDRVLLSSISSSCCYDAGKEVEVVEMPSDLNNNFYGVRDPERPWAMICHRDPRDLHRVPTPQEKLAAAREDLRRAQDEIADLKSKFETMAVAWRTLSEAFAAPTV